MAAPGEKAQNFSRIFVCIFPCRSLFQAWFILLKLFLRLCALKHKLGFTVLPQLVKSQEVKTKRGRGEKKKKGESEYSHDGVYC